MYAVGQPFDRGATYFKCNLETGKKWKGIDSWKWASIEDEEGNSLGEDLETDSNDRSILDELREKTTEWVLHRDFGIDDENFEFSILNKQLSMTDVKIYY